MSHHSPPAIRTTPVTTRPSAALLVVALLLAACGHPDQADSRAPATDGIPVLDLAAEATLVDLGACLQMATGTIAADETCCPAFIAAAAGEARSLCADVGGTLRPAADSRVWSLDVDADGRDEYLFDVSANYYCDGAPSVLSCGSLGCPQGLYRFRDGAWQTLGDLHAGDAPAAEVLPAATAGQPGTIRGGCNGLRPCAEWSYYDWNGAAYRWSRIDAGGHWVDVEPGGLWTATAEQAVFAAPDTAAPVLARYPAGTDMVVIGTAREAPFRYVSPCNACERGFVPAASLQKRP